jgi:AGZA family xanthine/uracil permease-like MFS transporter
LSAESNNGPLLGGQMLENYFNYKKHKTDFKTEVVAGTTTFLTMAYIMFLNPFILSGEFAGPEKGFFDFGAVYTATILATALACFIMAFYGKTWPIGLAPGMGINAFVAFGVCAGYGIHTSRGFRCSTSCWCIVFNNISYTY